MNNLKKNLKIKLYNKYMWKLFERSLIHSMCCIFCISHSNLECKFYIIYRIYVANPG